MGILIQTHDANGRNRLLKQNGKEIKSKIIYLSCFFCLMIIIRNNLLIGYEASFVTWQPLRSF